MRITPDMCGAWFDPNNPGWGITLLVAAGVNAVECGTLYAHDFRGEQVWFLLLPALDGDGYDVMKPAGTGFPITGESRVGKPVGRVYITGGADGCNLTWSIEPSALGRAIDFSPTPPRIEGSALLKPLVMV